MEELADKERFFAQIEEGRSSPVDYGELNRQQDLTATTGTLREFEEELRKQDTDNLQSESPHNHKNSSTPSHSSSNSSSNSSSSSKNSSVSSSRCTSPSHKDTPRDQLPTSDLDRATSDREDRASDSKQTTPETADIGRSDPSKYKANRSPWQPVIILTLLCAY
jgi:activator of HSP90 ATPase